MTSMCRNDGNIYAGNEISRLEIELAAARAEIDRLLTLTSEQATEIVGKDKALADANDAKGTAQAFQALLERQLFEANVEVERQSVLLGKAETALENIAKQELTTTSPVEIARAALSELQLKPCAR